MLFFVVEKQTKINEEKTSEKRFEKKGFKAHFSCNLDLWTDDSNLSTGLLSSFILNYINIIMSKQNQT